MKSAHHAHHACEYRSGDIVHQRAKALGITPQELFARAYATAGRSRTASMLPFDEYHHKDGSHRIPPEVTAFCELPLPHCANPDCPTPDAPAHFSHTELNGGTLYFCSPACMGATPVYAPPKVRKPATVTKLYHSLPPPASEAGVRSRPFPQKPAPSRPRTAPGLRKVGTAAPFTREPDPEPVRKARKAETVTRLVTRAAQMPSASVGAMTASVRLKTATPIISAREGHPMLDETRTATDNETKASTDGRTILDRVRIAMSRATYIEVPPGSIRPMQGQPRTYFNKALLKRLADSFKSVGQITPGIVRKVENDTSGCEYELLDGERRLHAAHKAKLAVYRAMLVEIDDQAAPYVVSVIANFHREGHTLLELSDSIVQMHDNLGLTHHEIADILGLSCYVKASILYGLKRLIPEVRDLLDPNLVKGHPLPKGAAILISHADPRDQLALATKMMKKELTLGSLREQVRCAAEMRGIAIPKRKKSPDDRRKSVRKRTHALLRSVQDLDQILHEEGMAEALLELPVAQLHELQQQHLLIQGALDSCRTAIDDLLTKKSGSA